MFANAPFVRIVSIVPVLLIALLFLFELYVYNAIFLRTILPIQGRQASIVPFAVIFNTLWFLAFWSFVKCVITNPGVVKWSMWPSFSREANLPTSKVRGWSPRTATWCEQCEASRPERAHHCSVCDTCVLRMDHHCPWLGNCVGQHNHKFFMLLGFWGSLTAMFFIATSLPDVMLSMPDDRKTQNAVLEQYVALPMAVGGMLAFAFGVGLMAVFGVHVCLLWSNKTSIESNYLGDNPYVGGTMENLTQVMGPLSIWWLVPVAPKNACDGMAFENRTCLPCNGEGEKESLLRGRKFLNREDELLAYYKGAGSAASAEKHGAEAV